MGSNGSITHFIFKGVVNLFRVTPVSHRKRAQIITDNQVNLCGHTGSAAVRFRCMREAALAGAPLKICGPVSFVTRLHFSLGDFHRGGCSDGRRHNTSLIFKITPKWSHKTIQSANTNHRCHWIITLHYANYLFQNIPLILHLAI